VKDTRSPATVSLAAHHWDRRLSPLGRRPWNRRYIGLLV
jgi:hypothetical protein